MWDNFTTVLETAWASQPSSSCASVASSTGVTERKIPRYTHEAATQGHSRPLHTGSTVRTGPLHYT